jgi:hypothetical protein
MRLSAIAEVFQGPLSAIANTFSAQTDNSLENPNKLPI